MRRNRLVIIESFVLTLIVPSGIGRAGCQRIPGETDRRAVSKRNFTGELRHAYMRAVSDVRKSPMSSSVGRPVYSESAKCNPRASEN